jgi:phage-related holin
MKTITLLSVIKSRIGAAVMLGIPFSLFTAFFEKYVFSDWQFAMYMAMMIGLDTVTGVLKHWKLHTVSSKKFGNIFIKCLIYAAVLILTHNLKHFQIGSEGPNPFFGWIDDLMYSSLVIKESISIIENLGAIQPGLIPKWILKRLKDFDETGEINKLNPNGNTPEAN